MSQPDLNKCCSCTGGLPPEQRETDQFKRHFSLGLWVACPSCEMRGPTTWITLECADIPYEFECAQRDAARAWNRLTAAAKLGQELSQLVVDNDPSDDNGDRMVSLRGRAV